jgi:hypothetical protein
MPEVETIGSLHLVLIDCGDGLDRTHSGRPFVLPGFPQSAGWVCPTFFDFLSNDHILVGHIYINIENRSTSEKIGHEMA